MKEGKSLGKALQDISKALDSGNKGRLFQLRIASLWVKVAGESVASHTAGVYLRSGELQVQVDSPVWATELSALSEKYREAINSEFGGDPVKSVRFTVSKEAGAASILATLQDDASSQTATDDARRVSLSDQEVRQIQESASIIPDLELREAVIRATIADFEWKKGIRSAKGREKGSGEP